MSPNDPKYTFTDQDGEETPISAASADDIVRRVEGIPDPELTDADEEGDPDLAS